MTDKKTEHAPVPCQCNGSPIQRTICVNMHQIHCENCGRRGVIAETMALAIADWNRRTAAPDLLTALKGTNHVLAKAVQQLNKDDRCSALVTACCQTSTDALAAIAKAEPKS